MKARYELKYVIAETLARRIALFAAAYCDRDAFLRDGVTSYVVTNLYLDSPNLRYYWEKKTLRWARVKARVRTYGAVNDGPVFLELKRRYGDIVAKSRARVHPVAWAPWLQAPVSTEPLGQDERGARVVDDFRVQYERFRLRPVVSIRYDREPWIGRFDDEVRVTFDRAIRFARTSDLEIPSDERRYEALIFGGGLTTAEAKVVLELKFNGAFPRWMQRLVETFDLDRGSFSKYARALDQIGAESLSYAPSALQSTLR